jgi:hypothetical protein
VRRRDDDPVRRAAPAAAVVGQDRAVDDDVDAVRRQHLDDRALRRRAQRVRVAPEEQRPVDPRAGAVAVHGLGDGCHVRLGEGAVERRAAVAGGAERHGLGRRLVVVGRDQPIDVDEVLLRRQLAGARIGALRHARSSPAVRCNSPSITAAPPP